MVNRAIDPFDFAQGRLSIAFDGSVSRLSDILRAAIWNIFGTSLRDFRTKKGDELRQVMPHKYFRKKRKFRIATAQTGLLKRYNREKERASSRWYKAISGRGGR